MDPNRRIALSLAVIALSAAGTALAWRLRPPTPPPPAASNVPVFAFSPAEVSELHIEAGSRRLAARRDADGWQVSEVAGPPVESAATDPVPPPARDEVDGVINSLLREIVGLPVIDRFPRAGAALAGFGLETPRTTIALGLAGGATRRLEVGATTIAANAMYARAAPPDDVLEVGTLLLTTIDSALFRLRGLALRAPGATAGRTP